MAGLVPRVGAPLTAPRRQLPAPGSLELLRACGDFDADGYVKLQTIPYRAHHLLADAVLTVAPPGGRVFEGGVSSGYFARVLVSAGLHVSGHELDPATAAQARSVCDQVFVGDLQTFDVAEMSHDVDVLLFGDTLEHLADPAEVLRRLSTRLRPGGHLVVSVPNVANWSVRLSLLAGRFRYTERGILDGTHLRFFTRTTLVELIEAAGFTVTSFRAAVPVPGVTSERAARLVHRVGQLAPGLLAYNFVVTAAKLPTPPEAA